MLAVRLPPDIERRLEALAKRTGRSKSHYVRVAIIDYLQTGESHRVAEPRDRYGAPEGVLQLTAVLLPAEEGGFVVLNPETGAASQGETIDEALASLREATELHLAEFPALPYGRALMTTFEIKPATAHADPAA